MNVCIGICAVFLCDTRFILYNLVNMLFMCVKYLIPQGKKTLINAPWCQTAEHENTHPQTDV